VQDSTTQNVLSTFPGTFLFSLLGESTCYHAKLALQRALQTSTLETGRKNLLGLSNRLFLPGLAL
jgi:uncharacterized membrane protein